jgi:hypothetical protein
MSNYLFVPIHLDALFLGHPQSVVDAMADFSRLPYFNGTRSVNPDTAYISEEIVSHPFNDQHLHLEAGIHLHWALPDALCQGKSVKEEIVEDGEVIKVIHKVIFPVVPNRWLVTRTDGDENRKQWIVESDYLFPPGTGNSLASISYPFEDGIHPQPYRYMGRNLPLDGIPYQQEPHAQYLPKLTAIGYGEPNFSSFYPNCRSVFGFHDREYHIDNPPPQGLKYDLIGWYNDSEQDELHSFVADLREKAANRNLDPEAIKAAIQQNFDWHFTLEDGQELPERMACYAHLSFETDVRTTTDPYKSRQYVSLALGNTSTEALSAYLYHELGESGARMEKNLEEQLEALHLTAQLEGRKVDIGLKFKEVRHDQEFTAVPAGTIWTVRHAGSNPRPGDNPQEAAKLYMHREIAHLLNQLNLRQRIYDQAQQEIESLRRQLFSDWYKYMTCAYPPSGTKDNYPQLDEVKYFIEKAELIPLERKIAACGTLSLHTSVKGHLIDAVDTSESSDTLADKLVHSIQEVLTNLYLLHVHDVQDWPGFLEILANNELLVRHLLPAGLQAIPQALQPTDQEILVNGLNQILQEQQPYPETLFTDIELSSEVRDLLEHRAALSELQNLYLNRLLLGALLPQHINPTPVLFQSAAPRYWKPNEPVILLAGEQLGTSRHGEDGELACKILSIPAGIRIADYFLASANQGVSMFPLLDEDATGYRQRTQQPWHPYLLEWEVEFYPLSSALFCITNQNQVRDIKEALNKFQFHEALNTAFRDHGVGNFTEVEIVNQGFHYWLIRETSRRGRIFAIQHEEDHLCVFNKTSWVSDHYELKENEVNLSLKPGKGQIKRGANVYHGRSILTPHARLQLRQRIDTFLSRRLLPYYYEFAEQAPPLEERTNDYFSLYKGAILNWYAGRRDEETDELQKEKNKLTDQLIRVANYLDQTPKYYLAQSLGGFNEALLGRRSTLQLPIDDPLGFPDYQDFARAMKDAIQNSNRSAPPATNDFNPIRAGALKIHRLQLVDTFGRVQELDIGRVISTEVMGLPFSSGTSMFTGSAMLPPRIVQPARMNFRWLSATPDIANHQDEAEMNAHPNSSPICGWLIPNNLDGSFMVYDPQGQAQGAIDLEGKWRFAPGHAVLPRDIRNPHLRKLVEYLRRQEEETPRFLAGLLDGVERVLEQIDPENFSHNEALALLMGRPMAIVRASLNLELLGLPATDPGWRAFRQDIQAFFRGQLKSRNYGTFAQVEFPIRLGEFNQLNDGLVGFWKETATEDGNYTYEDRRFYLNNKDAGNIAEHSRITHYADDPDIYQTLESAPQKITMLMDPRGVVHLTSGILPTKAIDIPPEQFAEALKAMEVSFLTAPVLSDRGALKLPLPDEPGFGWSWLSKENGRWEEDFQIDPVNFNASFGQKQVLREGWLKLRKNEE